MTFCCYNHFTGRSRNPTTQVLLVNYKVLKVRNKTGLIFFFLLPKLLLRTSKERKQNWNPLCVWSYSTFTGLSEHFHSSALLPASPSSWWSSKAVILYLTKKSLIFSWISSLKQLTCLHKQHDQHKVRIVWLEARREDVTTAGPRHLPKPIQQKQLITFEVLLSNYKISEKLLAPWTSEN